jgi:hypothetical protein
VEEEKEEMGTSSGMRCDRQNAAAQVGREGLLWRGRYVEEGIKVDESSMVRVELYRLLNIQQLVYYY